MTILAIKTSRLAEWTFSRQTANTGLMHLQRGIMTWSDTKFLYVDLEIQATTDVDIFSHLGWKTMDIKQDELAKANFLINVPFIGFGSCTYKATSVGDFEGAKNARDAAKLYFQTMRTACLQDQVDAFHEIITNGWVKFNGDDKTFYVPDKLSLL
jgi:hypothetical protein